MADDTAPAASAERRCGVVFVLAAAVAWSAGGLGVKLIDAPALAIAGFRSLFAITVLGGALVVHARTTRADLAAALRVLLTNPLVWGAAAGYALMVVCFVLAAKLTTAANAILLQYTAPIYVALLSWPLLRERLRVWDWVAVAGTILGMTLFFADKVSSTSGQLGNLVAVASSFGFASLPLQLRFAQHRLEGEGARGVRLVAMLPLVATLLGNVIAVLVCVPWMVSHPPHTAVAWGILVSLGTLQLGLAYVLYGAGVRRLRAVESTLLCTLEPILNPIWVFLGTGERPSASAITGGAIIVLAVTAQGVAAGRRGAEGKGRASC
jgi:drug/metabolite transporter (DMT)-like permease